LTFIGPLDPGPAQDLGNYTLLAQGPHGSFFHKIGLRSATYIAASQTVVLVPKGPLNLHHTYELRVKGTPPTGLASPLGIPLADGNQTVIFRGFGTDPSHAATDGPRAVAHQRVR
jgi:hypothetical protein